VVGAGVLDALADGVGLIMGSAELIDVLATTANAAVAASVDETKAIIVFFTSFPFNSIGLLALP
jgi:hypothetical protein